MKNSILITCSIILLIIDISICNALSVSDLKEGQFVVGVKHGQKISLISNKAKLSDIVNDISKKMNVGIKIHGDRDNELISFDIVDVFLGDVLKRILRNNYIIEFRVIGNQTIVSGSNLVSSGFSDSERSNQEYYIFPIRPGTKGWEKLETVEEIYQSAQIPKDILENMDTKSLIKTCLEHPILMITDNFDTLQNEFKNLRNNFNGLNELLNRKDAGDNLLSEYQAINIEEIVRESERWTTDQKRTFLIKSKLLEMLLSQDIITSGFTSSQQHALANKSLSAQLSELSFVPQ
jgi:hypothetical protein